MKITFATERSINRWFGDLQFACGGEHCPRGERQRKGVASFLRDHDPTQPVGRFTGAAELVESERGRVKRLDIEVEMGTTPLAVATAEEINQGLRNGVSAGYDIYKLEMIEEGDWEKGTADKYRAVDWDFFEISSVTAPANPDARVRGKASMDDGSDTDILLCEPVFAAHVSDEYRLVRAAKQEFQAKKHEVVYGSAEESEAGQAEDDAGADATEAEGQAEEQGQESESDEEVRDDMTTQAVETPVAASHEVIVELAELSGHPEAQSLAWQAIKAGSDVPAFKEKLKSLQIQADTITSAAKAAVTGGEMYDLGAVTRYILGGNNGGPHTHTANKDVGYALQLHDQLSQGGVPNQEMVSGMLKDGGLLMPAGAMSGKAALVASTNASGAIEIMVDESRYLDWLLEPSRILMMCDVVMDATADMRIPIGSGSGPQASYVAENAASITDTSAAWATVMPVPHPLIVTMDYTELANIRTGGFVARRLSEGFGAATAWAIDRAIIQGDGTAPNPRGLENPTGTPAMNTSTWDKDSTITWANVVNMEESVQHWGPFMNYAFAASSNIYSALRTTVRASGQLGFIINSVDVNMGTGSIDGVPVLRSDHVATDTMLYGPFNQVCVPFWGMVAMGNYRFPGNPLRMRLFTLQYHDVVLKRNDLFHRITKST